MRSADSVLRELNARLDLPARRRALLLRELRSDFEDLVAALVAEGLSPEAAHARALEMIAPSDDDVGVLAGLHRSRYARLTDRLGTGRVHVLERVGIGALAALAAAAPALALAQVGRTSILTLAVLGCVAPFLVGHLAWQTYRIVVRDDADAGSLARAGRIQAALVALTVAAGAFAVATEAYTATGVWSSHGIGLVDVAMVVARCASAAALTLGLTILGVFGALALLQWHMSARSVEDELRSLLDSAIPFERSS